MEAFLIIFFSTVLIPMLFMFRVNLLSMAISPFLKYNKMFCDWSIDNYCLKSPCNKYSLWVANGASAFKDYNGYTFLRGLSFYNKAKLWTFYKKELKIRSIKNTGL